MSLVIAGERSGVGKTTVTLALLSWLSRHGCNVQSFKTGPDYIDPMFHSYVTGKYCRNLDPILTSENYIQSCFQYHCQNAEFAVIEGVMGLFDGVPFSAYQSFASTAHIAKILDLPVLLILDCRSISNSIAAIASGFRNFDPRLNFAGVVLNRVASDRHRHLLEQALEGLNLPILGVFYRDQELTIPDRHLGLIPTGELANLNLILDKLATIAEKSFNWDKLLPLLKVNHLPAKPLFLGDSHPKSLRIAVAYDQAFNFYYQDNFDILRHFGAELIFWSPLKDQNIPENVQGFYFGGGFPEVFAAQLSENITVRRSLFQALKSGIPTLAECGGLMYLCQAIRDFQEQDYPMVGIFPNHITVMDQRLTLGYRQAKVLQNTPFLKVGETVYGHEFHRSKLIDLALKPNHEPLLQINPLYGEQKNSFEGLTIPNIYASYLHLHFGNFPLIAQRFCQV
jgi:cobyrinic acid a,c-diamide synthase